MTGECNFDGSEDVTMQVSSSNVVVLERYIESEKDCTFEYPERFSCRKYYCNFNNERY